MNRDLVEELLEYIKSQPEELVDMHRYFSNEEVLDRIEEGSTADITCGTVACIAGHATLLFGIKLTDDMYYLYVDVGRYLGLHERDSHKLMMVAIEAKGKEAAINRLSYLLEHGTMLNYEYMEELTMLQQ